MTSELEQATAAVKAAFPDRTEWTAGDLASHLPEHLRQPFWEEMIDRYLTQALVEEGT